jgi:hypothetical protein
MFNVDGLRDFIYARNAEVICWVGFQMLEKYCKLVPEGILQILELFVNRFMQATEVIVDIQESSGCYINFGSILNWAS